MRTLRNYTGDTKLSARCNENTHDDVVAISLVVAGLMTPKPHKH